MNKFLKIISAIVSAAVILTFAGCSDTSAPSVPILSIPAAPQSAPDASDSSGASGAANDGNSDRPQGASSGTSQSGTESADVPAASSGNDTPAPPEIAPPTEQGGEMSGNIFVCSDGRGIVLFGGDAGGGTVYADSLNKVKVNVGPKVNVFSMIIPTAGSFYLPQEFSGYMGSEWDAIAHVNEQMTGIIPIDAFTALAAHTSEEIFARTDHHWMQLGAYYAAEEFVKKAKITEFPALEDYEKREVEGYLGTLYGYSDENATMAANPETFVYYIGPNDFQTYYMNPLDPGFSMNRMFLDMPVSSSYSIFMGGDNKVVHVQTDVRNKRKLLIIKDSYANAIVPCLTGSFEEIWTVDMRYLTNMEYFPHSISEIVEENGITDVLFCMDSFSAVGQNAYHLPDIV